MNPVTSQSSSFSYSSMKKSKCAWFVILFSTCICLYLGSESLHTCPLNLHVSSLVYLGISRNFTLFFNSTRTAALWDFMGFFSYLSYYFVLYLLRCICTQVYFSLYFGNNELLQDNFSLLLKNKIFPSLEVRRQNFQCRKMSQIRTAFVLLML